MLYKLGHLYKEGRIISMARKSHLSQTSIKKNILHFIQNCTNHIILH